MKLFLKCETILIHFDTHKTQFFLIGFPESLVEEGVLVGSSRLHLFSPKNPLGWIWAIFGQKWDKTDDKGQK